MTHTSDDYRHLLRAIAQQPAEDTPRLMLADYLEECGDASDRARAEFIRVQVELASDPTRKHCSCAACSDPAGQQTVCRVLRRERDILDAYSAVWRRPLCVRCKGRGWNPFPDPAGGSELKDECRTCKGDGSTGALSEKDDPIGACNFGEGTVYPPAPWKHTVTWQRGFPVVEVPFDAMGSGGYNAAHGEIPWDFDPAWKVWAIRAVREGASFKVSGREPFPDSATTLGKNVSRTYDWLTHSILADGASVAVIPQMLFDRMKKGREDHITPMSGGGEALEHDIPELALSALNDAATSLVVGWAYPAAEVTA